MSSWGLGNTIFKITIFTWLFKYLVPKVNLMGRSRKVSFKFLQTLCAFRTYIYIYTCIQNKNCHQHSYGFENLMSSWGLGNTIFKITIFTWVFKYLVPKVNGYQVQKKFVNDFLKISKTCQYLSFGGGFNFRLGNYNVPSGSSANPYGEFFLEGINLI